MQIDCGAARWLSLCWLLALSTFGASILKFKLGSSWLIAYSIAITVVVQGKNAFEKRGQLQAKEAEAAARTAEKAVSRAEGGNRKKRKQRRR